MAIEPTQPSLEEASAKLELAFIDEYLRQRGHDPDALRHRTDDVARELLKQASMYASAKLTEMESRAHYVEDIHKRP